MGSRIVYHRNSLKVVAMTSMSRFLLAAYHKNGLINNGFFPQQQNASGPQPT